MILDEQTIQQLVVQNTTPLMVLDCAQVIEQYQLLQQALPSVDFFFAVKALPHPALVNTLNQQGLGFDIASQGEIELLRAQYINPRCSIHTHPIKKDEDIKAALRFGCTTFVVDNADELHKFVAYRNRVGLLLRLSFRNSDAQVDLSKKFGCRPDDAMHLLLEAKRLGIHVKGLSFHVGSQCRSADMHVYAIHQCHKIMTEYHRQSDSLLSIIDIGGGFPVNYDGQTQDIAHFCHPIREAISQLPAELEIIAEPGRYLVAPAAIAVSSVVGKANREGRPWYYLDDGVYGVYSGRIFDHVHYPIKALKQGPLFPSVLAGPTCDSIDVIEEAIDLPCLDIGDLVVGEMIGAYSTATATRFNSLVATTIVTLNAPEQIPVSYIA
ncbi:MAG: type III PLP-dependent enzyme [Methylococcales bacterium]|jgi:ornithine decarboxylase|nr:type III PLP-dependent enzyme [Methylococcales bacterium]